MSWALRDTDRAAREGLREGEGGGGWVGWLLNKFLYGGGPPLNLLYTIFHNFVYLLLTNGTPFTYLA